MIVKLSALAVASLAALSVWAQHDSKTAPVATATPIGPATPTVLHDEGYVGPQECRACHADNFESWFASYHRRMTQVATPDAVLAPHDSRTPPLKGVAWQLSREADSIFATPVSTIGEPLAPKERIAITTGSHHYQIYWLETPTEPELAQLPLVWHLQEKRWIPRQSVFLAPPPPSVYMEGGRWPRGCIQCHTTNGVSKHETDGRTHVAEFGISCEACHGPGAEHVALEKELELQGDSAEPASGRRIVDPSTLAHDRSSQVCGQCHGIHLFDAENTKKWAREGFTYRPGQDLAASRELVRGTPDKNSAAMRAILDTRPTTLESSFWSDGVVRVSGREYNGLVESPCYQRGEMSCLSCHEMHPSSKEPEALQRWANDQLKPGMDGPRACLQCHTEYGEDEKLRSHTRHATGSSGSDCLNCHMPYTTYGLTKAIRSHTITSPSVATTLATRRPNACNQCHLDRTLAWTADRLHEWFEHPRPKLSGDQENVAASVVDALTGDAGLRAITAWNLGWAPARAVSGTGWMPYLVTTLLQDPYDAVRFIAMRTARLDPRYASFGLEFTDDLRVQRDVVRSGMLADWMQRGLAAPTGRGDAVLVRPDGTLDEARFRALFSRVDGRSVSLAE
jgi:hypothetical protein